MLQTKSLKTENTSCPKWHEDVVVSLHTVKYADEISWDIRDSKGNFFCHSDSYHESPFIYEKRCCVPPGAIITCKDSYGDAWHGGFLQIDRFKYCTAAFGYEMQEAYALKRNF